MSEGPLQTLSEAIAKHRANDFAGAERQYREILAAYRGHPTGNPDLGEAVAHANHNLGALALDRGQPALGIPHLKAALDMSPGEGLFWLSYARALLTTGQIRAAVSVLEQAKRNGAEGDELNQLTALADRRSGALSNYANDIVSMIGTFAPGSPGDIGTRAELTLGGANRVFGLLAQLVAGNKAAIGGAFQPIESLCGDGATRAAATQLAELFTRYGSDKAAAHNYHELYGFILRDAVPVGAILEIGLGTNNEDVVSNMSRRGRPGASLRAFRDYLPRATVYGADIDKRILFTEDRIETFYVDQLDPATLDDLARAVPDELDLIIDDGLHSPDANLAVLIFAMKKIRRGGWIIIEDIWPQALPVWKVAAALLPWNFTARILVGRSAYVFAVQRLHEEPETVPR